MAYWYVACTVLVLVTMTFSSCHGHGRLRDPPSRSSLWRDAEFASVAPKNYNDNQLFCGGFGYQTTQGGKCGICGDPWGEERENEPPHGRFAKGIISREYRQGELFTIKVEVTAFHKGWFEFRMCANNDVTTPATQDCLDRHLLASSLNQTRFVPTGNGWWEYRLQLPTGLVCSQCVIQWKYHTGNSWGVDPDGTGCVGCGPQEEFYGCADVSISSTGTTTRTTTTTPTTRTTSSTSRTTTTTAAPTRTTSVPASTCRGVGENARNPLLTPWCVLNCAAGFCPETHCKCG